MIPGMKPAAVLGSNKPHGTRLRYLAGCKCVPCRAANSRYSCSRALAVKNGKWNGIVSAQPSRRHLLKLARRGVGRRLISRLCGVPESSLQAIKLGRKLHVRKATETAILKISPDTKSQAALVPAGPAWKLIALLQEEGFTKCAIARRLGNKRALQLHKDRITYRNHAKVHILYRQSMEI